MDLHKELGSLGYQCIRVCGLGLFYSRSEKLVSGGSWVVISGVIIRVTMVITHIRGLATSLLNPISPVNPKPYQPYKPSQPYKL